MPYLNAGGTWVAPARFQRDTTKFWMRPQDAMRFKAEMIRHVPVLIYGHGPFLSGLSISQMQTAGGFALHSKGVLSTCHH